MEPQLQELFQFVRDRNPQVRQIALSNLLGQTPKGSPYRNIFFADLQAGGLQKPKDNGIIRDLKLLCRDQLAIAHDAFRALVNLSDSPLLVASLSDPSFLEFILSYIINPNAVLADLASMLLSNLTASPTACSAVLTTNISVAPDTSFSDSFYPSQSRCGTCLAPVPYPTGDPRDVPALPLLINAFVQSAQMISAPNQSPQRKGQLHFLASVFANLTVSPAGRSFFLTPRPANFLKPDSDIEFPLSKIVSFTEHPDMIRRGGTASALKNCAFHASAHCALLSPETTKTIVSPSTSSAPGIDILPCLLLPLAGPEEFDLDDQDRLLPALQLLPPTKKREPDPVLRLTHIETLLLLCSTRWGRDYLRNNGVYEIVRSAHEVETVEKISEEIERLVTLLKGEEGQGTHEEEFLEVEGVQGVDEEDEDSKIEEV